MFHRTQLVSELVTSGRVQSSWGAGRLGQGPEQGVGQGRMLGQGLGQGPGQGLGQAPGRRLGQGLGQGKGLWLDSPEEGNRTESGD